MKQSYLLPLLLLLSGVIVAILAVSFHVIHPITTPQESESPTGTITAPTGGNGTCVNTCGNGQCEEIVCEAIGCPCAETALSCPQDCKAK